MIFQCHIRRTFEASILVWALKKSSSTLLKSFFFIKQIHLFHLCKIIKNWSSYTLTFDLSIVWLKENMEISWKNMQLIPKTPMYLPFLKPKQQKWKFSKFVLLSLSSPQNNWPEILSDIRINSIAKLNIFQLIWYFYLQVLFVSDSLTISPSIDLILLVRVCICNGSIKKIFSKIKPHRQSRLIQSLKLSVFLQRVTWFKPDSRQVCDFNPTG